MKNRTTPMLFILFVLSMLGLVQFSNEVRTVDIVGLFASGALAGVALATFLISRKN